MRKMIRLVSVGGLAAFLLAVPGALAQDTPPIPAPTTPPAGAEPDWTSPASVSLALAGVLAQHFGDVFTTSTKRFLQCPQAELDPEHKGAFCLYAFRDTDGIFHDGSVTIADGKLAKAKTEKSDHSLARCAVADVSRPSRWRTILLRRLRTNGQLSCADLTARSGWMLATEKATARSYPRHRTAPDLEVNPKLRAFPDFNVYHCRTTIKAVRGFDASTYAIDCANAIGDRVTYAFTIGTTKS
jgi:hypothetical protein